MGQNIGRAGRRRRVMKEEVLSASFAAYNSSPHNAGMEPGDTPRYGVGANIENHPQITDFVPRRYRVIGLISILGIAVGIFSEFVYFFAPQLGEWTQVMVGGEIREILSERFLAWASAAMFLAVACYASLIYSLRRHRVDASRGQYRVWRIAIWTAVALSFNAVVQIHEPLASVLGHRTQWNLLPQHMGWWLVPASLLGGWLLIKLIVDARECRTTLLAYGLTLICFGGAAAGNLGWAPAQLENLPGILSRALPFAANLLLLTGTLLYARYIVLDVQGLIEHRETTIVQKNPAQKPLQQTAKTEVATSTNSAETPSADKWVDGSEPEANGESMVSKRLSKAERKRLRKQKNQKRAA